MGSTSRASIRRRQPGRRATGYGSRPSSTRSPSSCSRGASTEPDSRYIDVVGTSFTAAHVADTAGRLAAAFGGLGLERGDRVASVVENSPEAMLLWWGITLGGRGERADQHGIQG